MQRNSRETAETGSGEKSNQQVQTVNHTLQRGGACARQRNKHGKNHTGTYFLNRGAGRCGNYIHFGENRLRRQRGGQAIESRQYQTGKAARRQKTAESDPDHTPSDRRIPDRGYGRLYGMHSGNAELCMMRGGGEVSKMKELKERADQYAKEHMKAFEEWKHGGVADAWLHEGNGNIVCVQYEDGSWWHYEETPEGLEWWQEKSAYITSAKTVSAHLIKQHYCNRGV